MSESSNVFWAAFGGAAAAGIVTLFAMLIAEWYRWFLDRPLVRVKASVGYLISSASVDKTQQIFLEASNAHTKPVTLSTFGFSYNRKEWGTLWVSPQAGYQFPYQLDGGKSIRQWLTIDELIRALRQSGRTAPDLKWVWFTSSSGKTYRGKVDKKTLKQIEKAY